MTITAIKDFRIKESYTKLIEKALWSYLWEGIYKPLFEIMQIKPDKAQNSIDAISQALRAGKIYYVDGGFKAKDKFTNAQSLELKKWGAKWDNYQKMFRIEPEKIPQSVAVTLAESEILAKQQIQYVQDYLKEVQANMPYIVESMVFNNEVITILDDAGNEIHKNVKHINVIEPKLSIEQKREIARTYTNNVRDYVIKDFAQERIPEMRGKIQELVLQGYRPDKVQELLQKEYKKELDLLKVTLPKVDKIPQVRFDKAKELVAEKYNRTIRNPFDLEPEEEALIGQYFKEEMDADFVFVTHYPSKKRPFYAMDDPEDTTYTLSFDLLFHGLEITTGGQRIHDYQTLVDKIADRGMTQEGMEQYMMIFKHGMPPHGGLGIGMERLTMKLLGEENVRETTLFPRDLNRLEP